MSNYDYPNMSYCMMENTSLAMNQIIEAFENDNVEIINLSQSEKRSLSELILQCEKLLEIADCKNIVY